MNYLISIKTAIIVFPVISLIFTIPFLLHNYHKYGSINPFRVLIIYSFILYMITIYFLVILPLPNKSDVIQKEGMIRLIPFEFISDFISETSFVLTDPSTYLKALFESCFYTVIFNLFMTIPFGMYTRYYFKCNLKKTIILSFLLSLFFEITQLTGLYHIYPYAYRVFDVDDLIINTLGGMIGYAFMGIVDKYLPTREEIDDESFRNSIVVSGLRRIAIFYLDNFLFIFLFIFISIFIRMKSLVFIVFIIYYIILPYIKNGYTIGSKFLNVRLEFEKHRLINIIFRIIFLFAYYYGIIFISLYLILSITKRLSLTIEISFWLYIGVTIFLIIFYIINGLIIFKKKKHFYDNLFKVKYINTIKKGDLAGEVFDKYGE